jgi:hypothetical protein
MFGRPQSQELTREPGPADEIPPPRLTGLDSTPADVLRDTSTPTYRPSLALPPYSELGSDQFGISDVRSRPRRSCQSLADQSNAVVPPALSRTSEARSMPTMPAKSKSLGHPIGKWTAISRFDPNRTTLASTQPVLTGLSIRINSGTARTMAFSASTNAPSRLMLSNVAPILRRPSGASKWMLERLFTTSQRRDALRSSGRRIMTILGLGDAVD